MNENEELDLIEIEEIPLEQELFNEQLQSWEWIQEEPEEEFELIEPITEEERIVEEFKLNRAPTPVWLDLTTKEKNWVINLSTRGLTKNQELFCQYYTSATYSWDAFMSYCKAYNFEPQTKAEMARARTYVYKLKNNKKISARIKDLIKEKCWLDADMVDTKLAFLIHQSADLATSLGAIKEYNKMTWRSKENVQITGANWWNIWLQFLMPVNWRELPEMLESWDKQALLEEEEAIRELEELDNLT